MDDIIGNVVDRLISTGLSEDEALELIAALIHEFDEFMDSTNSASQGFYS